MAAGARLAAERDRWPEHWLVADLEQEEDHLLGALSADEELLAVIPGLLPTTRHAPVLVGVTDRRVLIVTRWASPVADRVTVTDVTTCATTADRDAPVHLDGRELLLDVGADAVDRVWELVEDLATAGRPPLAGCGSGSAP